MSRVYFATKSDSDPTPSADRVIEVGTDGIWTYKKWESGDVECFGRSEQTIPANGMAAWGETLFTYNGTENFPTGLFVDTPTAIISPHSGGLAFFAGIRSAVVTKTQAGFAVFSRSNPTSQTTARVSIYARGRWKA